MREFVLLPITECSDSDFHCEENFACVASAVRCDGIANCYGGEDEMDCTEGKKKWGNVSLISS